MQFVSKTSLNFPHLLLFFWQHFSKLTFMVSLKIPEMVNSYFFMSGPKWAPNKSLVLPKKWKSFRKVFPLRALKIFSDCPFFLISFITFRFCSIWQENVWKYSWAGRTKSPWSIWHLPPRIRLSLQDLADRRQWHRKEFNPLPILWWIFLG